MRHFALCFAALAMAATGGAMAAKKPSKDQIQFEEAQKLSEAKKYTEANVIFDSLCKKRIAAACQSSGYNKGMLHFEAKNYLEAAKAFDAVCKEGVVEACENAKIATKNHEIVSKVTPEDLAKQRRAAAFDAALAQYKAKQYDEASAGFGALCKEGMDSGCQNEAAIILEQSGNVLKNAKRPNGQDCSNAVIASDFCRAPMEQAITVLSKICPSQSTNKAVVGACARRSELQRYIAETDKQIGNRN